VAAVVAVLALVTGLLAVLVVGLLRSHGEILRALHELGIDMEAGGQRTFSAAPRQPAAGAAAGGGADSGSGPRGGELPQAADIDGVAVDGSNVHVAVTGVDHATLLAFLTTGCELCLGFWEALGDPEQRRQIGDDVRIVAVTQGEQAEMPSALARMAPGDLTTVMSPAAWDAYNVPVAPFFALVDGVTGQVIGEGAAPSWPQLVDLLGRVVSDGAGPTSRRRGRRGGGGGTRGSGHGGSRPAGKRWAEREADTDQALLAAGIVPGDPRLRHAPLTAGETSQPAGDDDPAQRR
jgi:hypothetical protein